MSAVKDATILIEEDFARSAWYDERFAVWFAPFATHHIVANGPRASAFFRECGAFAKAYKNSPGSSGDGPSGILSPSAAEWYATLEFPPLPGGKTHKPTAWQIEKARRYLRGRHDAKLAEQLLEAEEVRRGGDAARADRIAAEARRMFSTFSDSDVQCEKALSDPDEILRLAESDPPLFFIDGEVGRLLNYRLKPNNLGIILGDQKIAKTTTAIGLAVMSAKSVPTLFVSVGDEGKAEVNARIHTYLSCEATQPEFAGTFAMPVPDCQHSADGSCPIALAGKPRDVKSWKKLIEDGAEPMDLAEGTFAGSRTFDGDIYQPCARCFPTNDGTPEDAERRRRWKSAVWYRKQSFALCNRKSLADTKNSFEIDSFGGGLRVAAYTADKLTIEMLEELLDTLDRMENFVPRTLVIDYPAMMKQTLGRDSDKDHDGMRRIWEGLSALRTARDMLILAPAQTNGDSEGLETLTRRTIGRSKTAGDNCTWLATLNQTIVERRAKLMRMSILFARKGAFDPERQALCCMWHEAQDSFAFSMPVFVKTTAPIERKDR